MATVRVQANCRACRSDVDEFKGPGSMSMITVPLLYFCGPNHAATNYRSVKVIAGFMTHFFL